MPPPLPHTHTHRSFQSGVKLWLPNHSQPEPNLAVFQINTALPASYDATFVTRPASSSAQERLSGLRGECECAGGVPVWLLAWLVAWLRRW
jgi:hypothetical protein